MVCSGYISTESRPGIRRLCNRHSCERGEAMGKIPTFKKRARGMLSKVESEAVEQVGQEAGKAPAADGDGRLLAQHVSHGSHGAQGAHGPPRSHGAHRSPRAHGTLGSHGSHGTLFRQGTGPGSRRGKGFMCGCSTRPSSVDEGSTRRASIRLWQQCSHNGRERRNLGGL